MKTDIKNLTDKQLKEELEAIWQQIEDIGSYGLKDLMYRDLLERELDNRELEIRKVIEVR